jgi:hypothetical protein
LQHEFVKNIDGTYREKGQIPHVLRLFLRIPCGTIDQEELESLSCSPNMKWFAGFAYQGKDIVFRFIMEHSSLRDFGP